MKEGTSIIFQSHGSFVYFIQITSDILVVGYAFFLKSTNRGFSFIIEPPHDFWIKENYMSSKNLMVLIAGGVSFVTLSLTFVLIYISNILSFITMAILAFAISFYFSHRRDYEDVRCAVEKYRGKNKGG